MADLTADLLSLQGLANSQDSPPSYRFLVSDVPNRFQTIAERFLGRSLGDVEVVKLPL
jgi:glutamate racemase